MVKAYLRYAQGLSFGVAASGGASCRWVEEASRLAVPALEKVNVWNPRSGTLARCLVPQPVGESEGACAEVTALASSPDGTVLAAGHGDGMIRVWNVQRAECRATMRGHKSSVTALRFSGDGANLCSGGKDTDVCVWDAVSGEGITRLVGHTNQVTDVAFLLSGTKVASASKDGRARVFNLQTEHCERVLSESKEEVHSCEPSPEGDRLFVASREGVIRCYVVAPDDEQGEGGVGECLGESTQEARRRGTPVSHCASHLAHLASDREVEVLRVRTCEEARRHAKRRVKRQQGKSAREQRQVAEEGVLAQDEVVKLATVRVGAKAKAFSIVPGREGPSLAVTLGNNALEVHSIYSSSGSSERTASLDSFGHRTDVRAAAVTSGSDKIVTAGEGLAKVWSASTGACLRSVPCGYALSLAIAPGDRFAAVGCKSGEFQILDCEAGVLVSTTQAHSGALWSVCLLPDGTGLLTGAADRFVKMWEWIIQRKEEGGEGEGSKRVLTVREGNSMEMSDEVLCARVSPDGKLVLAALLDSTVRVHFADTLKPFLSLYGHKLPVLSMDVSHDSNLLVTASADKDARVWGLDFGDCHGSMFAHSDSVMAACFLPGTHHFFTAGKDGYLRYWDADKRERLLDLAGHHAEVWSLAVSPGGDFVVSSGHDKSVRKWDRTEEAFFLEEERERRLESTLEEDAPAGMPGKGEDKRLPAKRSRDTEAAADSVLEAMELAENEEKRLQGEGAGGGKPNPLLLGLSPDEYVLRAVSSVRASELEQALLLLPFASAVSLLGFCARWLRRGTDLELACRVATLLLGLHYPQLSSSRTSRQALLSLHEHLRPRLKQLRDSIGFNVAAMGALKRHFPSS